MQEAFRRALRDYFMTGLGKRQAWMSSRTLRVRSSYIMLIKTASKSAVVEVEETPSEDQPKRSFVQIAEEIVETVQEVATQL